MKIAFYCSSGSPTRINPDMIYTRGVGGAELALMSLAEELARLGNSVTVYNNPDKPGEYNNVSYLPLAGYNDLETDVLVLFRTPWNGVEISHAKKVFWSCDQFTEGNFRRDIFPHVDHIICISPRHVDYFNQRYNNDGAYTNKITYFDLGVRQQDYQFDNPPQRVKNRMIYCSAPNRGLERVRRIWPTIKQNVPNAELYVTFDYRMWGADSPHIDKSWRPEGVHYLGGISRMELTRLQLSSDIQLYPCTYDELFCIAVAECQVAGAIPFTSGEGALATTNEFGFIGGFGHSNHQGNEWLQDYTEFVINVLADPDYHYALIDNIREDVMQLARDRFNWTKIARQWMELLNQ